MPKYETRCFQSVILTNTCYHCFTCSFVKKLLWVNENKKSYNCNKITKFPKHFILSNVYKSKPLIIKATMVLISLYRREVMSRISLRVIPLLVRQSCTISNLFLSMPSSLTILRWSFPDPCPHVMQSIM